jgi:hypothetical protein
MLASGHDDETGLLEVASLSLEDLSLLDDSVVANVIKDLVERRRCGAEYAERFSQWNASP